MDAKKQPFRKGMIIIWYGLTGTIPSGWVECNGSNGTPNLRGKFVIGASADPPQGTSGGSLSHTHTGSPANHQHAIGGGTDIASGSGYEAYSAGPSTTGNTGGCTDYPPFYSLVYIMKL